MQPDFDTYCRLAENARMVPLWIDLQPDQETPVTVFRKLVGGDRGFLLESLSEDEEGRYSIIGADVLDHHICGPEENPFSALRAFVNPDNRSDDIPGAPFFLGGGVGYIGYDAVRHLESLPDRPPVDPPFPEAQFMHCGLLAVIDHLRPRFSLVVPTRPGGSPDLRQTYEAAKERLREGLSRLAGAVKAGPVIPVTGRDTSGLVRKVRSNLHREAFMQRVVQARDAINAGEAFQIVLSRRLEFPVPGDPFHLYRALRVINPSPYMFFLRLGEDTALLGASPERLVQVVERHATTRPLAGTRRRGSSPEADVALAEELANDPKERAEHTMLVDLGRNDLGRICRYGTVRVDRFMSIRRYSDVMHLASDVSGELAEGYDAVDALAACFPAGTLSGAPKIRAMEIIDALEPVSRGPYGGTVGYLTFGGRLDACITIRSVWVCQGVGYLQVGAGVVADSDPAREFEETEAKGRALVRALELLEQMGKDPIPEFAPKGARA